MLIEFSVENFRSFAGTCTLSMIASKDSSHPNSVVETGGFRLLKVGAIYGANASGKSNLVNALGFMERFVTRSATRMNLGDPIAGIEPFRLDRQRRAQPSSFAVRLLIDGTEYQYGFSAAMERVHSEWLRLKREGGRVTSALMREYDAAANETRWHLHGDLKDQARSAMKATRDNGLFLSQAAQMNVEFVNELFLWFRHRLWHFDLSTPPMHLVQQTARRVSEDEDFRRRVERLVHDADLGIGQLAAKKEALSLKDVPKEFHELVSQLPRTEHYDIRTFHDSLDSDEAVEFSLERDESFGTQRFFGIVGQMLRALDNGDVLVVDELDCSMHPLLTEKLVELVQSNEANPKGAQLIFATHDSSLMNPSLLRRDQIWFTEKNDRAATELYSLCDVERTPRKREAFEKNYLAGRYGGVPSFGPALEDFEVQ
ncbi:MAG: AAA family ATPase [Pirellulales bacterium]